MHIVEGITWSFRHSWEPYLRDLCEVVRHGPRERSSVEVRWCWMMDRIVCLLARVFQTRRGHTNAFVSSLTSPSRSTSTWRVTPVESEVACATFDDEAHDVQELVRYDVAFIRALDHRLNSLVDVVLRSTKFVRAPDSQPKCCEAKCDARVTT